MSLSARNHGSLGAVVAKGRPFIKMHGLRNDFVIVDGRRETYQPSISEIIAVCDRHEGVGADELLIIEPARVNPKDNYAFVRILNPDGREVEACGNATRCVAWLFMQEIGRNAVTIETLGGQLNCQSSGEKQVTVNMGCLRTQWDQIPLTHEMDTLHLGITAGPLYDPVGMNIGNPHAVFFVKELAEIDLEKWGPELQTNPLFPEEANIGAVQILDEKRFKLSVWERPGNLTPACGSGACAAVGAAKRRGLIKDKKVKVEMQAGPLEIELLDDGTVEMTGPATVCFHGYLPAW